MPSSTSRSWEALTPSLSEWILGAVASMDFQRMTPVQASAIPLFMGNKDVVVEAVTGSGKTLAFLIPTVERILRLDEVVKKHHVAAIIVSPTRELATQIHNVLVSLLGFHGPSAAALKPPEEDNASVSEDDEDGVIREQTPPPIYPDSTPKVVPQLLVGGSTSPTEDLRFFLKKSPNLLIATPGRLLEILSSPHVHCPQSSFEVLIMDEADRLLDLGFKDDLQKILGHLPKQRRTGLFSASVSEALDQLIRVGLRNPVKIVVKVRSLSGGGDQRTPASLRMTYLTMPASFQLPAIVKLIHSSNPIPAKSIIYLSTCAGVDYYHHLLSSMLTTSTSSVTVIPLHGKHPPNIRQKNFTRFSNATKPSILLTTDVAARGLDIPQVDLVIQIDAPSDPKVFLHRCGRAGRAGRKGLAVIFLHPGREEDYIPFLQVRKTPIVPLEEPMITVSEAEAAAVTADLRHLVQQDRALHDKGQRAFVSWLQAYSKHQAASIFRVADLDWTDLGNAWALLKLPKMPEIKKWEGDRSLGVDMDWNTYSYKDKVREKQRVDALQAVNDNDDEKNLKPKSESTFKRDIKSWSQKLGAMEDRTRRREQRHAKRKHETLDKMNVEERGRQEELDRMIEEVKKRRLLEDDAPFEGFHD